jgi:hypothetical protein
MKGLDEGGINKILEVKPFNAGTFLDLAGPPGVDDTKLNLAVYPANCYPIAVDYGCENAFDA